MQYWAFRGEHQVSLGGDLDGDDQNRPSALARLEVAAVRPCQQV